MRTLHDTYYLTLRALRESLRQPAIELTNIFIPMFFFAVIVGAIGNVAGRAFGVTNFLGFQMPVAILQAVAGTAGSAGLATVTDIERGYFDKLLLTPAARLALLLGRIAADGIRAMLLTALVVVAGLVFGSGMDSGPLGAIVIIILGGLFGVAYSGIGMAIALRTGSPQAAQAGFLIFFPLLFLSPAMAPKEVFAGGKADLDLLACDLLLSTDVAEYLARASVALYAPAAPKPAPQRKLSLQDAPSLDFDDAMPLHAAEDVAPAGRGQRTPAEAAAAAAEAALGSILGLSAFTLSMTFLALRSRTS